MSWMCTLAGQELYLLRNLSKGKGVDFFSGKSFYPDFILWILGGNRQRIVFVEPHGMLHATAYQHDEKARLHEKLPALAQDVGQRSGRNDIDLDAFIVSATAYDDLYQHYDDGTWDRGKFAEKHILFVDRTPEYDYMKLLLGAQLRNRLEIDHEPAERTEPAIFWGMDQPPLVHL